MNIAGIGIVTARGRGIESFRTALSEGWRKPEPAYTIASETLRDNAVLKDMRRADDLCKMACLAASDAVSDSGIGADERSNLGIILGTAFGPHPTTFRFLDDIISFGDTEVSPTTFSHSVHNAALSYVSTNLQSRGPTLTITQFAHSFHQAVSLAEAWLEEGRCDHILVGVADQYGTVMDYICRQKLNIASDGRIKPFSCDPKPAAVPGEGSVFFLVTNKDVKNGYSTIKAERSSYSAKPDLFVLDADGMTGDERPYLELKKTGSPLTGFTPLFGSTLTGGGFSCAAAALMLRDQHRFAAPVSDNPHDLDLVIGHGPAELKKIQCVKFGCRGEKIEFSLERYK